MLLALSFGLQAKGIRLQVQAPGCLGVGRGLCM